MKKIISFLIAFLLLPFVAKASDRVFAFEEVEYNVFTDKMITLKPVAQGINETLTYKWFSENEGVAKVANGKVTGVASGTTTITCTAISKNGDTYSAQCKINVSKPIEKITVDQKEVILARSPSLIATSPYSEFTPKLTIYPEDATNKNILWSTSDWRVADVFEDGKIAGRGPGKATITGVASDGSGIKVKIQVEVPNVMVTEDEVVVDSPDGKVWGYQMNGSYNSSFGTSGDVFSLEPMDDKYAFRWYRIVPKKSGTGEIVFTYNGTRIRVKVKVEHSAVFDDVFYPTGTKDTKVGEKASFTGSIVSSSDETYFLKVKNGEYVSFDYNVKNYNIGDVLTVYGTVDSDTIFHTQTGLSYTCPVLKVAKIVKEQ